LGRSTDVTGARRGSEADGGADLGTGVGGMTKEL